MAKSARGRLKQVELWLRANYPVVLPVRVQVRKLVNSEDGLPIDGFFHRVGERFSICVAPNPLHMMIDTLLHEWAHMLAWSPTVEEMGVEHPDEWGLWDARLRRAFYDEEGWKDAQEFSLRPRK